MTTQIIVTVRLIVPPGMSPWEATDEIRKGIEFGKPEIQLVYVLESNQESNQCPPIPNPITTNCES